MHSYASHWWAFSFFQWVQHLKLDSSTIFHREASIAFFTCGVLKWWDKLHIFTSKRTVEKVLDIWGSLFTFDQVTKSVDLIRSKSFIFLSLCFFLWNQGSDRWNNWLVLVANCHCFSSWGCYEVVFLQPQQDVFWNSFVSCLQFVDRNPIAMIPHCLH